MAMNTICHIEWWSTDFERTKNFFGGLFGWTFNELGDEFMLFSTPEGGPGGGFIKCTEVTKSGGARVYVWVDDVDAYIEKVKALGGTIVREKAEITEVSWSADFKDPDGNEIGLYEFVEQGES